jgi:ABC-type glycerol-3-phosphate transport system substrate-binding protein
VRLLLLVLLLTGLACAEPVEIEFWHAMRGQRSQVIERLAERFHQQNPDVTVRPRLVVDSGARLGNDYSALYRSLLEAIARGNPPTVAQVYENWTTQLLEVDALVPVETFGSVDTSDFVPVFLAANRFGGKLWTLPFNKSLWVMYYNKEVLKRLGLTPPKTWEELRATARKISAEGSMPGLVFQPGVDTFGHYLVSNGGQFIEGGKAGFGGALGDRDMSFWVNLVHQDRSAFAHPQGGGHLRPGWSGPLARDDFQDPPAGAGDGPRLWSDHRPRGDSPGHPVRGHEPGHLRPQHPGSAEGGGRLHPLLDQP